MRISPAAAAAAVCTLLAFSCTYQIRTYIPGGPTVTQKMTDIHDDMIYSYAIVQWDLKKQMNFLTKKLWLGNCVYVRTYNT